MKVQSATPSAHDDMLSKVPAVTLAFWAIKICATTVGETGGDALSMSLHLGYLVSTFIFLGLFVVTLAIQVASRRFHPLFYWAVVVATTTVGTTTSDYIDRTLKLGYPLASLLLSLGVVAILILWRFSTGTIAVDRITTRKNEVFYWVTILVSNTLGTALGDYAADDVPVPAFLHNMFPGLEATGLGFEGGAILFAGLIALVGLAHYFTRIPKPLLFWAAYVLTRPLGATLGDMLTKPMDHGGLNLGRFASSGVILLVMVVLVWATERRRGRAAPEAQARA